MKNLVKLAKKNAIIIFKFLKKASPIYSKCLNEKVYITNLFLNHIISRRNKRNFEDLIGRILIIPFLDRVLKEGEIQETRVVLSRQYIRISLKHESINMSVIILKTEKKHLLLSCFIDKKKKDLS